MADQPQTHRTDEARAHDDHELIEAASRETAPSAQGRSGGIHTDIGIRDDLNAVTEPDGRTSTHKSDKVQPIIPTRADNDGANG